MNARPSFRARLIAARERLGAEPEKMARRLLTPRNIYLRWERGTLPVPGAAVVAAEAIAPAAGTFVALVGRLADGSRTRGEIAHKLGLSVAQVAMALRQLRHRHRLIAPIKGSMDGRHKIYSEAVIRQIAQLIKDGASARAASILILGHYSRSAADRATAITPSLFRGRPLQTGGRS